MEYCCSEIGPILELETFEVGTSGVISISFSDFPQTKSNKHGSFSGSGGEYLFGGAPGRTKEICLECPCSRGGGGLGGMAHPGAVVGLSSTPCLVFFFSSSLQTHRDVQDHLYHLKSPGLPSESFAGSCPLTQKTGCIGGWWKKRTERKMMALKRGRFCQGAVGLFFERFLLRCLIKRGFSKTKDDTPQIQISPRNN